MPLIDSASNGATEVPGTSADSMFVVLAGPIRAWWGEGMWNTREHQDFTYWRERIHEDLSADYLLYAPHRAWRGPWNELAQIVNDHAIVMAHVVVALRVPGILAAGTDAECKLAAENDIPIVEIVIDGGKTYESVAAAYIKLDKIDKARTPDRKVTPPA